MDFYDIRPDMRDMVRSYTKPWELHGSEYTFTNLLMWGGGGRIRLCEEDGALFFLLHDNGERFMFAPLTRTRGEGYEEALNRATDWCICNGIAPLYKAISGPLVSEFENAGYELIEDRNNFDYIYSGESLLTLAGKKLHAKRNHINRFRSLYDFEYIKIDPGMEDECLAVYCNWLESKDPDEPGVREEMYAIRAVIEHMDMLGVVGGGIRIDGALAAFTLGERIDGRMAVIHIEKADGGIEGLYTVINQQFIEHEFADMELINREEDMGLEGLRKAKLSYNPVTLLEKYEGRPR